MYSYNHIQAQGIKISEMVFHLTEKFPKYGSEGLTDTLRKAALKVVNNIEEGCGISHSIEAAHFFKRAVRELDQLKTHIQQAKDVGCMGMVGFELVALNVERCRENLQSRATYYKQVA